MYTPVNTKTCKYIYYFILLYLFILFFFHFSWLSNRIMRKIFNHWRLEPVYKLLYTENVELTSSNQQRKQRKLHLTCIESQLFTYDCIYTFVYGGCITKTYLYNFDPLEPHFYTVKLGFKGVYIIFLISAQNIDCGYSLEPPRRGGSDGYPQSMFLSRIVKNIRVFYLKISRFWR